MKLADELMASSKCETLIRLLMKLGTSHCPTVDCKRQKAPSYMSGTILMDWHTMKSTEIEMRTMPKLASRRCLDVVSGSISLS